MRPQQEIWANQPVGGLKVQPRSQTIYASSIAHFSGAIATWASFKVSAKLNDVHLDGITQECDRFFILRSTSPTVINVMKIN